MTAQLPITGIVFSVTFYDANNANIFAFSNQLTLTPLFIGPAIGEDFAFVDAPAGKQYLGQVASVTKTMNYDGRNISLSILVTRRNSAERTWP